MNTKKVLQTPRTIFNHRISWHWLMAVVCFSTSNIQLARRRYHRPQLLALWWRVHLLLVPSTADASNTTQCYLRFLTPYSNLFNCYGTGIQFYRFNCWIHANYQMCYDFIVCNIARLKYITKRYDKEVYDFFM